MHCCWALHIDLTHSDTTNRFLQELDQWVTNTVAQLEPSGTWTSENQWRLFDEFLYLATFRSELKSFLLKHNLPTDVCDHAPGWHRFIEHYASVVKDGSLSAIKGPNSLRAIQKVTFEIGDGLTDEYHVPFVIRWVIQLKDGRTIRVSVEASRRSGNYSVSTSLDPR